MPSLYTPTRMGPYLGLCPNSEVHLSRAFDYIGSPDESPILLADCLIGKKWVLVSGLCFRTQEFSNGAVFMRGIWYRPRTSMDHYDFINPKSIYGKITALTLEQSESYPEEEVVLDIHPRYPHSVPTNKIIVWRNCGGVWEPAREMCTENRFPWVSEG